MKDANINQSARLLEVFGGVSYETLKTILDSKFLIDIIQAVQSGNPVNRHMIRRVLGLGPFIQTYKVIVDSNISLAEMIDAGKYDRVYDDMTEKHFSVHSFGSQEIEIVLFDFNWWKSEIDAGDVIRGFNEEGFRGAGIQELLAFGAQYPTLQLKFSILAPGSLWRNPSGQNLVPVLGSNKRYYHGDENDRERSLYLAVWDTGWFSKGTRFAAVKKNESEVK